jgi:spore coat protein CotF
MEHKEQYYHQYNQNYPQYQEQQQYQQQQQFQQQQQVVQNPQSNIVPEVKGPEMNDRDYINDILATEKYLSSSYNVFTWEASHTDLYNEVKQILLETNDCARDVFNLMFKDGFYTLKASTPQEIQQEQQKFSNYLNHQDPYRQNQNW